MKRIVNSKLLSRLIYDLGPKAIKRVSAKSKVGLSTIEKLKAGTHVCFPKDLTRKLLCDTLGVSEDELFPFSRRKDPAA